MYIAGVVFFSPNVRGPYAEAGANDEQGAGAELCAKLRVLLRSPPIWAIVAANSAHNYGCEPRHLICPRDDPIELSLDRPAIGGT